MELLFISKINRRNLLAFQFNQVFCEVKFKSMTFQVLRVFQIFQVFQTLQVFHFPENPGVSGY